MTKNLHPVKPSKGDGDEAGRLSKCSYCPAQVRWVKTEAGKSIPCDPDLVCVRLDAHGEDALAHREQVVLAWDQGPHAKGAVVRGVRCWEGREGALVGRIPHWATCPGRGQARADKDAKSVQEPPKLAAQEAPKSKDAATQVLPQVEGWGELVLDGAGRRDLAELLRDLLEEELERRGCVWTDTPRGVQITRETRPEAGGVGASRIARLCAAVRLVEGLEAGTWRARRGRGGEL